jgi:hypothetical protein
MGQDVLGLQAYTKTGYVLSMLPSTGNHFHYLYFSGLNKTEPSRFILHAVTGFI